MLSFILKKIVYSILVLLGVLTLVFFLFNVLPADPARMTQGQRSDVASLEAVKKEFGLDKPLYLQYLLYLNDVSPISINTNDSTEQAKYHYILLCNVRGNNALVIKKPYLRRSYQTKKEVATLLLDTLPNTLVLAFSAMLFATVIGIALGILAALYKDGWVDKIALSFSVIGISMPSFFAGILVAWLFGFLLSNYTGLSMSGSLYDYDPFMGEQLTLKNLILPAFTLGMRPLAIIVQLTRNSMLEVLGLDYIRTAKAKGLDNYTVVTKHALKNALNPVVTVISGWLASLMAGAFFIEYIFGWNGLGKATVDALEQSDFPVIMGAVLLVATIFVVMNSIVDVLYTLLDPRIRID